ncbi:MAG: hypothetical protein O0W93_00035, partial [Methanocorpusculum sp.]|nr:hypothetical protein [Methanocorpusculum sp.]
MCSYFVTAPTGYRSSPLSASSSFNNKSGTSPPYTSRTDLTREEILALFSYQDIGHSKHHRDCSPTSVEPPKKNNQIPGMYDKTST